METNYDVYFSDLGSLREVKDAYYNYECIEKNYKCSECAFNAWGKAFNYKDYVSCAAFIDWLTEPAKVY